MIQVQWFEKYHLCPRCGTDWVDEWSCTCNDKCPECHLESSPILSRDLSRELLPEDFEYAERRLGLRPTGQFRQGAWLATAEQARSFAESRLEGR
jgi:hypothetical protein